MIETFNYICIKEILNRVLRHPLLKKLTMEDAIYYTLDFIRTVGLPQIYTNKEEVVTIDDYRALLPCDCIAVNAVKNCKTGIALKHLLAHFTANHNKLNGSPAYKIQSNVIYTNFKHGDVLVSYRAIMVDEEGLPMLPDDPTFLRALELYIKKEWFTILFDLGEIRSDILTNTQIEYASATSICKAKYMMPSEDEMEAIGSIIHRLLPNKLQHMRSFSNAHDGELLRNHNPYSKLGDRDYE